MQLQIRSDRASDSCSERWVLASPSFNSELTQRSTKAPDRTIWPGIKTYFKLCLLCISFKGSLSLMKHCTCKALISFPSKYNYKITDTWRLWLPCYSGKHCPLMTGLILFNYMGSQCFVSVINTYSENKTPCRLQDESHIILLHLNFGNTNIIAYKAHQSTQNEKKQFPCPMQSCNAMRAFDMN